jgi:hypothetical protein
MPGNQRCPLTRPRERCAQKGPGCGSIRGPAGLWLDFLPIGEWCQRGTQGFGLQHQRVPTPRQGRAGTRGVGCCRWLFPPVCGNTGELRNGFFDRRRRDLSGSTGAVRSRTIRNTPDISHDSCSKQIVPLPLSQASSQFRRHLVLTGRFPAMPGKERVQSGNVGLAKSCCQRPGRRGGNSASNRAPRAGIISIKRRRAHGY